MKDLALVACGMVLGWSLENAVWALRPHIDPRLLRAASWTGRQWRRLTGRVPQQWFRRSDARQGARPLPPRPQPGPRPVVGQRPASGAHRATQRQVRFGTRTFRRRTKAG